VSLAKARPSRLSRPSDAFGLVFRPRLIGVGDMQGEHLQKETVFRPTARGIERLLDGGRAVASGKRARLRPGKLRHGTAVREVYIAARLHERVGSWVVTELRFDSELTGDPVLRAARLIPDVLVRAVDGGHRLIVFVEVDLGSEPVCTVRAKLDRYDALRDAVPEYGPAEVVVVVEGDSRRRRVEGIARRPQVRVVDPGDLAPPWSPVRARRTRPRFAPTNTGGLASTRNNTRGAAAGTGDVGALGARRPHPSLAPSEACTSANLVYMVVSK
jgi:hypothetical protein